MTDLPFELLLSLYRNRSIEDIAYVLVGSLISNRLVRVENEQLVLTAASLPQPIRKFLKHFKLNGSNSIPWDRVEALADCLFEILKKRKFLTKVPLLGVLKTSSYREFVRENMHTGNASIVSFIASGDKKLLDSIDGRISKTTFVFQVPEGFYSFYKDNADAYRNGISTTLGITDLNRYRYYYNRSGDKRTIE